LTFFIYLTRYNWAKYTERPRAKPHLINYFPKYNVEKSSEDYARIKMMLHHPFREEVDSLLLTPTQEYLNWTSVYQHCFNTHGDTHPYFDIDGFGDPVEIVEQDDMWELFEDDGENDLFWAEFAAQQPGRDGAEFEDPDALGRRDIDHAFNWSRFIDKYDISPTWLEEMKEAHPRVLEVGYTSQSMVDSLALKQRQAYDLVVNQALQHIRHRADILTTPRPRQLLYHIDGKAGTGKSFTIHCISVRG
jgi:hypothetical protein